MSKRKQNSDDETDAPPPKIQPTTSTEQPVDYFKEHFCQSLPESFVKRLAIENSGLERKIKFKAIDKKHVAQLMDNGFELVNF